MKWNKTDLEGVALVAHLGVPEVTLLLVQPRHGLQIVVEHNVGGVPGLLHRLSVRRPRDTLRLAQEGLCGALHSAQRGLLVEDTVRETAPVRAHLVGELLVLRAPGPDGPRVCEPLVVEDKGQLAGVVVPRDHVKETLHVVLKVVHVDRGLPTVRVEVTQQRTPRAREEPVTEHVPQHAALREDAGPTSGGGVGGDDLLDVRGVEEVTEDHRDVLVRGRVRRCKVGDEGDHGEEDGPLVLVGAKDHGHVREPTVGGLVQGRGGKLLLVDGGPPREERKQQGQGALGRVFRKGSRGQEDRGEGLLEGKSTQALQLRRGAVAAHLLGEDVTPGGGVAPRHPRDVGAREGGLRDRPGVEPVRVGHRQLGQHRATPRALPEDGDLGRVTAEVGDVLLNPLQSLPLVQKTPVAGCALLVAQTVEGEEAQGANAVVDADHNHILLLGEMLPVVPSKLHRVPNNEGPPIDPEHHGQFVARLRPPRAEHVEVQTVFLAEVEATNADLRAPPGGEVRLPRTRPGLRVDGPCEAVLPRGVIGEGDVPEDVHPLKQVRHAPHLARARVSLRTPEVAQVNEVEVRLLRIGQRLLSRPGNVENTGCPGEARQCQGTSPQHHNNKTPQSTTGSKKVQKL
eukprot:Hpha_TRINITY_DN15648_c1_g1::TRINITY_DN15648_c1_g1_i1::g.99695::m.99695